MGIFQNAILTYDSLTDIIGIYEKGKEPFAPVGHITAEPKYVVQIDSGGTFKEISPFTNYLSENSSRKVIIPVTEVSSSRSGQRPPAHPLCDKLEYISPENVEKHDLYLKELSSWAVSEYSCPKVKAILKYVQNGTILQDLENSNQTDIKQSELIVWDVIGLGNQSGPVWTDTNLMQLYTNYILNKISDQKNGICMVTGENSILSKLNLKGVVSDYGNAKLISSNDDKNYTYRGRFLNAEEASTISYLASQKAHNALKWLASNEGNIYGKRCVICWNPEGLKIPPVGFGIFKSKEKLIPSEYGKELNKVILGYTKEFKPNSNIVVAILDAATDGRLAVSYYNEFFYKDYFTKLQAWDSECCWYDSFKGTFSPSIDTIVKFAFGYQAEIGETVDLKFDDRILRQNVQKLVIAKLDNTGIPADIERALVCRCNNLKVYNRKNRAELLFTTCAVLRKRLIDRKKEVIDMSLETEKPDRSYQYGRLLAVMEKIEEDTYDDSKRETNAIRLQTTFVRRPAYTAAIIMEQLKKAYYPRLSEKRICYYERIIGQIYSMLSSFPDCECNKSLTETYLMGYYLQKNSFYEKKDINGEEK